MVTRRRLVAHLTTGSLATIATVASLALGAPTAGADSICPATLLPGEVCAVVDTVVGPLVPTPTTTPLPEPLPEPLPDVPLVPGPASPVPSPSSPPSNEGTAPAPSTPPGAGSASPASHPAAPRPPAPAVADRAAVAPLVVDATARGLDLPALDPASPVSPFALGPTLTPYATPNASSQLAAAAGRLPGTAGDGDLPRPTGPITLAVLLLAGALGAHGVRWVDRQGATRASASASGVDTGARHA